MSEYQGPHTPRPPLGEEVVPRHVRPHDMPWQPAPIPAELAEALRTWHAEVGYGCAAHSEGLDCCLDVLLGTIGPW